MLVVQTLQLVLKPLEMVSEDDWSWSGCGRFYDFLDEVIRQFSCSSSGCGCCKQLDLLQPAAEPHFKVVDTADSGAIPWLVLDTLKRLLPQYE